jgi:hypothetical protein
MRDAKKLWTSFDPTGIDGSALSELSTGDRLGASQERPQLFGSYR